MSTPTLQSIKAVEADDGKRGFRIGSVSVSLDSGRITGPGGTRQLDPKVLDVLVRLAAANGQVVSRQTLMDEVWKDVVVTDFALSRCIYQLRKNLRRVAQSKDSPIETLPKRGYRLTWAVEEPSSERAIDPGRRRPLWILVTASLLLAAAALTWLGWGPSPAVTLRPVLAILPFADLTPERSQAYFGDGIAQALLNELGRINEVDVIGRSSSFSLSKTDTPVDEIAAALGVDYLVEGSVNREAETVHVSVALIDAGTGRQLWSDTFEATAGGSFSVQREIAAEIAGHLRLSLGDPRSRGGTDNYQAFKAYLRATETDDPELASLFIDEALAHDGDYAEALVAKARLIHERAWQSIGSEEAAWAEAEPLLERALAKTEELPDAYALIAGFQMLREHFQAAEPALERALEINPSHTQAIAQLSRLLAKTGRIKEALLLAKRNVRLNPLSSYLHKELANRIWTAGDVEGGKLEFERALELDPLDEVVWTTYAYRLGDLESPLEGFRLVARLQRNPEFRARFMGTVPEISPKGVQLFGLWFGFIGDFKREREMLELQSQMADNARQHRELAWALLGEGDLDDAREEAWIGLAGMPRESIANFQVAYIALQTGQGLDDVLTHYREYWPGLFTEPPETDAVDKMLMIAAALIHRSLGDEERARRLLYALQQEGPDPFASSAMALAHVGSFDAALDVLEAHVADGEYFSHLPGDPFWAPLADNPRFMALVDTHDQKAASYRAAVDAMIETGELVIPGHLDD